VAVVNFFDNLTGQPHYQPYVMRQCGSKKIAFVGALTPETMNIEYYSFYDEQGRQLYDLREKDLYQLVQQSVDDARRAGADYVILLSHLGEAPDKMNIDSHQLIAATRGIDVVLDGHSHSVIPSERVLNKAGQPVLITQTGTKFQNIGHLLIAPDGRITASLLPAAQCPYESQRVKDCVDSINHLVNITTSQVLATCRVPLRINNEQGQRMVRRAETNAGDLVTDAFRYVMNTDIAISNGGGIRNERLSTDITYGDVIDMLPFENIMCKVEAKGSTILAMLQDVTSHLPAENGHFLQVSGLKFTVHTATHTISDACVLNAAGSYEPLDPDRTYTIGTITYCISNEETGELLPGFKLLKYTTMLYRDAVKTYLTEKLHGRLPAEYDAPQGRITIVE